MRNSLTEKKKAATSAKLNLMIKTDQFSQVSEEGSVSQAQQKEESIDEQLGWGYFHQINLQIQSLAKELLPKYKDYRNILYQSVKQICLEGHITKYDYSKLAKEPEPQSQEAIVKTQLVSLEDKTNMIQKIISERRIKKYYRNKHQINFQDELDPQDDQREIYKLYQQAFFKRDQANENQVKRNEKHGEIIYNDQYLAVPQSGNNIVSSKIVEIDNKMLDLSNQYNVDVDESFERMKYENQGINGIVKKGINYMKVNDGSVGFDHELSFDVKNQQYFVNSNNKHPFENSFGFIDLDKDEVNSQIRYDAQKMKKFLKTNKNGEKSSDQLSHGDQLFKNYIQKVHEQLSKQKLRVNQLAEKAEKVINNDLQLQEAKDDNNGQQDKISQLRYLLGEIVQIYSVQQCLKINLKFKSYELLHKLYQNASKYYDQEITFQQPLQVKHLSQIFQAALPQEQQDGIQIIVRNIFGDATSITYQQFLQKLTPTINDKQYEFIDSMSYTTTSSKSFDLTVRLFNVWIELDYFQKQLKVLLEKNQEIVDKFIEETKEDQMLMPQLISEFISKSKKIPKNKKLKTQIFFRSILGPKLMVSEFYRWIETKSQKTNEKFGKSKEAQSNVYDYHLY